MPDLPTRLARKWCADLWGPHTECPLEHCGTCRTIAAAIREALEEVRQYPFLRHDPTTGETNIIRCENCDVLQRRVKALEKAAKVILQECQNDVLGTEYSSPGTRALEAALRGEEANNG